MSAVDRLISRVKSYVERGERVSTDDASSLLELTNLIDFASLARVPRERRFGRDAFYHAEAVTEFDPNSTDGSRVFARLSSAELVRAFIDRSRPESPRPTVVVDSSVLMPGDTDVPLLLADLAECAAVVVADRDHVRTDLDQDWLDAWRRLHRTAQDFGARSVVSIAYGVDHEPSVLAGCLEQIRYLQDEGTNVAGVLLVPVWSPNPSAHYLQAPTAMQTLRLASVARIYLDNIGHIALPVARVGLEIAVLALSYGADLLDRSVQRNSIASLGGVGDGASLELSLPVVDDDESMDTTMSLGGADRARDSVLQRLTEGRWNPVPVDAACSVLPDHTIA